MPFDLQADPDAFYKPENREMLANIFPGNYGLSMDHMFLHFLQKKMPPKPWPKTVAGLPVYFAPEVGPQHTPRPFGTPVPRKNGSIAQDKNGRDLKDWEPLFNIVRHHFQVLEISITEVMYWGNYVIVILEHRNTDVSKLPQKVAILPAHTCTMMRWEDRQCIKPAASQTQRQGIPITVSTTPYGLD